jgi:hypothetical protein
MAALKQPMAKSPSLEQFRKLESAVVEAMQGLMRQSPKKNEAIVNYRDAYLEHRTGHTHREPEASLETLELRESEIDGTLAKRIRDIVDAQIIEQGLERQKG